MSVNIQFTKGSGIRLYTSHDEEYIDAVSGTFNLALGYSHPEVVDILQQQVKDLIHVSSSFTGELASNVLNSILEHAPEGITDGWMRDIIGSTANEGAVKIANKFNGKNEVLSLSLSHHGQTLFTTSISGNAFRRKSFANTISNKHAIVPAPYCYRCPYSAKYPNCGYLCTEAIYDYVEYGGSGNVSCIIMEPILGNGGNVVPPPGYFERIKKICDELDIVLISDEVQTGIGRTGYMFASEHFDMQPDIITLAKGLGGIGIPTAAILYRPEFAVLEKFEHSYTSGGNLLSLAAAQKTMEIVSREGFLENVRDNGVILGQLLNRLKEQYGHFIGDVRGMGYMWGLEIVDKDGAPDVPLTNRIIDKALEEHKLILRGSRYGFGNVVKVRPALTATVDDVQEICDRLDKLFSQL
ncbi:aminotransferase class III-fold pyridoxal phosphate-dependent enzyme [Chitinophaga filiformis]|uniref:aspartate aminotransferase family protein n=1 Tax=Chitinophaga filiformis TaxID=104663 RepID=UPI001F2F6C43|nr:aminotransferase class III-fold pyridoxal phosphate-dependent enzyme [Chitinophaga filiformis]MCF6402580.1 aminotransferase class III-fold pyridoxal phosphate-dependent enzyme [Chitinophaga filiformis]MCF6403502.1 aminotransferase class III-fold pyridoxal phosphate-dependent enzyme [Chitinophaga filiformis]